MARVPKPARPGAWTPPLARIEGDRLLKARQAEQRVREAQAKVEMEARRVEEMESQKLDEKVDDLRTQLNRLTEDLPKILPSGGGGKRMVAKVLARDYPDLTVFEGLAKTDGNFVVANGADWTVENGATARASLGLGTAAVANTGTSGDTVPKNNTANTFSNTQTVESAAGSAAFVLKKNVATQGNFLRGYTGSTIRWDLALGGGGAESGANAGAPFQVISYDDAGSLLGVPLSIVRATGVVTMPFGATVGDASGDPVILKGTTVNSYSSGLLDNADAAAWRTDLGLGSAAVLTAGDASGNLKALNADGGFTIETTPTPTINMGIVFGGTWKASNKEVVTSSGLLTGTYATKVIRWEGEGHNASGATQSGLPLFLESKKTNYLTSTTEGQILGTYTTVYGGRLGEHAAHLFTAQKVFDGTYSGSVLGVEGAIQKLNAAGTTTQHAQVYMGWAMSATGTNFAPDGIVGFAVEPRVGETYAAFAAVERSDLAGTPAFEYVLAASTSRDNANSFFRVTGTGHASGAGRVYGQGSASFPAFSFIGDENTGVVSPSADQVGFSTGGTTRFWVTTSGIQSTLPARFLNAFAIPANGSAGNGIMFSSTANFGVFFGSGAPTLSAAQGSLYLRSDGSGTTNRAYINTDGSTAWTALTTAA